MNLTAVSYYHLPNKQEFFKFLKNQSNSKDPSSQVMWSNNWQTENSTLLFILEYTNRFKELNGDFHIIFDQDRIIGCGGVYKSSFDKSLCFAGTRTWLDVEYRNKSIIRDFLLPIHKEWALDNNCKAIALCFNSHNKNIIETFKRTRFGESSERIKNRKPRNLFYNGLNIVPFSVNVQYTEQWVIYESIDDTWDFDWNTIKY